MKFISKNQTNNTHLKRTPKGNAYVSTKGMPFKVEDKDDQEFFSKQPQRYERVGGVVKAASAVKKAAKKAANKVKNKVSGKEEDDPVLIEFEDYAILAGASKEAGVKLKEKYESIDTLESYLSAGEQLIDVLEPEEANKIRSFYQEGGSYPRSLGGGWYELSNQEKVQGSDEAIEEENKLRNERRKGE